EMAKRTRFARFRGTDRAVFTGRRIDDHAESLIRLRASRCASDGGSSAFLGGRSQGLRKLRQLMRSRPPDSGVHYHHEYEPTRDTDRGECFAGVTRSHDRTPARVRSEQVIPLRYSI